MKEILSAIKTRWKRNLNHVPNEREILNREKHQSFNFAAIILLMSIVTIMAGYVMAQPVSFEGDVIISAGVNGGAFIDEIAECANNSEYVTVTNMSVLPTAANGSIKLHGKYEMPLYGFSTFMYDYVDLTR